MKRGLIFIKYESLLSCLIISYFFRNCFIKASSFINFKRMLQSLIIKRFYNVFSK